MTEEQLKELKDSGERTTQLVIDGKITNLRDLYQYSIEEDRCFTKEEKSFVEKWSDKVKEMSLQELNEAAMDTGVDQLILVGSLGFGMDRITIGDIFTPLAKEPKYEIIKRDFLNYMKHFLSRE